MRWIIGAFVLVLAAGCGLSERGDFLVGRQCDPTNGSSCDEGQACLPHSVVEGDLDEFRCRSAASFDPVRGVEAPLAYCNEEYECPAPLVCNADRIRVDGGFRRTVCKRDDDPFAPPLDAGPAW